MEKALQEALHETEVEDRQWREEINLEEANAETMELEESDTEL